MSPSKNLPAAPQQPCSPLGLPLPAIIGLALLATPRVVFHDLHLIEEGSFVNALFVFVPLAVWIFVVLWKKVPNPFLTLLVVGAFYGFFLMLGHQLLWSYAFAGDEPSLGGNLQHLGAETQGWIIRGFAAVSSLVTGTLVGAVTGLVAWAAQRVRAQRARRS